MEFDKSRVYTALNAEELNVKSEVILANNLESLRQQVEANSWPTYVKKLNCVMDASHINRFKSGDELYNLAYLMAMADEEPEDEKPRGVELEKEE